MGHPIKTKSVQYPGRTIIFHIIPYDPRKLFPREHNSIQIPGYHKPPATVPIRGYSSGVPVNQIKVHLSHTRRKQSRMMKKKASERARENPQDRGDPEKSVPLQTTTTRVPDN